MSITFAQSQENINCLNGMKCQAGTENLEYYKAIDFQCWTDSFIHYTDLDWFTEVQ